MSEQARACLQEDCANWDGHGCPCAVLDLEPVDVRRSSVSDWDDDEPCGCDVHPRWCAWNGPCCDDCSHGHEEAHAECCTTPPGQPTDGGTVSLDERFRKELARGRAIQVTGADLDGDRTAELIVAVWLPDGTTELHVFRRASR